MAHKTLIGGTAYEVTGGKTLIGGTAYSVANGKTFVGGTAYEVGFGVWKDSETGLEFVSDSPFTISAYQLWNGTMEYCNSKNGWQTWDGSEISSGKNNKGYAIYIRGTGNTTVIGNADSSNAWTLIGSGINCNGNISKLLDYATVATGAQPNMGMMCYSCMFFNCTSLVTPPELPATTLTLGCYWYMFYGCSALKTAPSLPATSLLDHCYSHMFVNCTSLVTPPELPATTLSYSCYRSMFSGCSALKTAPSLPATTLFYECYSYMFYGCKALTTAPSLPATTLASDCYSFMFASCSILKTLPKLPATTLPNNCYSNMFYACKAIKLSSEKTGTYTQTYRIPFSGVGSSGTDSLKNMFDMTGGTFTGTAGMHTNYYLDCPTQSYKEVNSK